MSIHHFTDSNFKKEVLESGLPVLVDFWATWCLPCKAIAPVLEELARDYKDKMRIGKVNVEENHRTASHYGIMSLPTLVFFKGGKVMEQIVGSSATKTEIRKKIEGNLK